MKLYKIKTSKSELLPLIPSVLEEDIPEGEMLLLTDDLSLFASIALEKHYKPEILKQINVDSVYEDQLTEGQLQFLEHYILCNVFWHYDNKYYAPNDVYLKFEKVIKVFSILLSEYIKEEYDDKNHDEFTFFGVYDFEHIDEVIDGCELTGLPCCKIHSEGFESLVRGGIND